MNINTLIPDVQALLKRKDGWFTPELSKELAHEVSIRLSEQFNKESKTPTLRLSQMGPRCPCALWHSIHAPDTAEPLPPWAEFKFAYGAIIEALAVTLAKAAGHRVEGEQDHVSVDGISGHRDCLIDGCLVDVKSASSFSFQKFKDGSIRHSDSFGYLEQLDGYLVGSAEDERLIVKDRGYLWAIDKQLGSMCLYEHIGRPEHIRQRIVEHKRTIAFDKAPACTCETQSDGKAGNIRLSTIAGYNAFKHQCFPGLRTFLYSDGPRYLSTVARRPQRADGSFITEVDKTGRLVYNS